MPYSRCKADLTESARVPLRSVENRHTAVVDAYRHTRTEVDDLGGRTLRDQLDSVEEDAVEDVLAADLASHHLSGIDGARLELEELGPHENLGVVAAARAVGREGSDRRLDSPGDDASREDVCCADELCGPSCRRREVELLG